MNWSSRGLDRYACRFTPASFARRKEEFAFRLFCRILRGKMVPLVQPQYLYMVDEELYRLGNASAPASIMFATRKTFTRMTEME